MASYTDSIPTFNPYVQTIPVDEMIKVGMYKQQKYDEGIQKIQTNIDNIAGLDVVRDVDKAYLQSKLNQLGNNLTSVAGGDFSNFQLVNSVNGMTNQIAKDPNVLNAIASAKTYRKGLEDMAAANKDGKGAASHDWLFKTDANEWLNNQEINKTFTGGYKQYSNYQKNAQEVIKGLVKNETGRDVAFETGPNGEMIVLDAITRTRISGITPERIRSALMVGLSPNDFQSMQIDGRYNYSNSTPEQFVNDANKSYKSDYDKLMKLRDATASSIDSTNSASEKYKLKQQVDSLDKSLSDLQSEYSSVTKTFAQGDVESAKARLHSTKWINNFSETFASKSDILSYETNAFQQPMQYRETKKIEYDKWLATFNQTERQFAANYALDVNADKRAERKDKREQAEADAKDFTWGGLGFSVPQNELPEVTAGRVAAKITADEVSINKSDAALMEDYDQVGNTSWLNQQLAKWQQNPGSVDATIASHFRDTQPKRREIIANQSMIVQITSEMDKKFGAISKYIPEGSPNITLKFPNSTVTYTPKDFVEFNEKVKNYVTAYGGGSTGGGGGGVTYNDKKARAELSEKDYFLYEALKNQKTDSQKTLVANLQNYNQKVNTPYKKVVEQRYKEENKMIQDRTVAMQGMKYGISLDNESQKTSFGNVLQEFADLADTQNGGLALSPNVTSKQIREVAADIQNANIEIVEATAFSPARYKITASDKEGTPVQFNMTPEQYRSVTKGRFDADPEILAIRDLETQQIRVGKGTTVDDKEKSKTTALDGKKTNVSNAFIGNGLDFVNVNHYSVSANLVTNQNGLSSLRLNITDPITGEILQEDLGYPKGFLLAKNKVNSAIKTLTDEIIFEILYNRKPTAAELKKIKQ